MSLAIFIIILSILVVVHEWGHFAAARSVGVKVEKFSVGFGPKLFSFMGKHTEFMICAIPLGGFVKLAGDDRRKLQGTEDEFFSHSVWHRAFIIIMGPVINFIFAYMCFYFIFVTGFPRLAPTVGKVMEDYPAYHAGLQEGDRIVRIDGTDIDSWEMLQKSIMNGKNEALSLVVERDNMESTVLITPRRKVIKNIFGQEESVSIIGIQPAGDITLLTYGAGESFYMAFDQLKEVTTMTFRALYHVSTGAMPAKDALAGPIRIFDVIKDALTEGVPYLVYIMAVISASLAIFNLFPIPVLDGGHLFLLFIEKLRNKPLPLKVEENLTKAGFSLLICLMVFVLYNDIIQVGWVENIKGFFANFK